MKYPRRKRTLGLKLLKNILIICLYPLGLACSSTEAGDSKTEKENQMNTPITFDWQGHRGTRGLLPENTIPAFLKALEYPIQTLELDVAISKDGKVVISHEPWMSSTICLTPDGAEITEEQEQFYKIYELDYESIQKFNCGKKHEKFPEQVGQAVAKPLLSDMIKSVEQYCEANNRTQPFYNIEIKSKPEWDDLFTPKPDTFAQLLIAVVTEAGISERTCIQSFDPRALEAVHQQAPELITAYLVWQSKTIKEYLQDLSYQPEILSPEYTLLDKGKVDVIHNLGMKVIPWTVNETEVMRQLIEMGVDGIITDYPNRIP